MKIYLAQGQGPTENILSIRGRQRPIQPIQIIGARASRKKRKKKLKVIYELAPAELLIYQLYSVLWLPYFFPFLLQIYVDQGTLFITCMDFLLLIKCMKTEKYSIQKLNVL